MTWYLMPSQLQRSYQGETQVVNSQVKVLFTSHVTGPFILEGDRKMKMNEPGKARK